MGVSADWSRLRFTLDEGLSKAVIVAFNRLYEQGIIYRGKRLVNWDPQLQTALSDLEVETRNRQGSMWHIAYPIIGEKDSSIVIATTRPETMPGDCAIAVHPDDPRYQKQIGKACQLPLFGRRLPIIADRYAEPEKGSGAVKITPAHDFHDFEVAQRHNLPLINIFTSRAHYNEHVPQAWQGLERMAARQKIVAMLEQQGLIDHVETTMIPTPYGDRSQVVIEPWLTDQWFADMRKLAAAARDAVTDGRMTFIPHSWTKTYLQWLDNIQPWCLSRQIQWGHRIPAWHSPDGSIFVATNEQQAQEKARKHYHGTPPPLRQDDDVLDTWFSSALWPFSTLGWPEQTQDLSQYYPTDVIVTGFDILFFWIARMAMMGIHFTKNVPFKNVYVHALVRDAQGQKMSKSRGNVIDPLVTIQNYGADSLRFTMAISATPGRDVRLSEEKIKAYRNFATKVWNAARFCFLHNVRYDDSIKPEQFKKTINRWLATKAARMAQSLDQALNQGRFDTAAKTIYHFIWHQFCDVYIEVAKTEQTKETQNAMAWGLAIILERLAPFMPFLCQRLWQELADDEDTLLCQRRLTPIPKMNDGQTIDRIIARTHALRALANDIDMDKKQKAKLHILKADEKEKQTLLAHKNIFFALTPIDSIDVNMPTKKDKTIHYSVNDEMFALTLPHTIDHNALYQHLTKKQQHWQKEEQLLKKKLADNHFRQKAPADIVEAKRKQWQDSQENHNRITSILANMKKG